MFSAAAVLWVPGVLLTGHLAPLTSRLIPRSGTCSSDCPAVCRPEAKLQHIPGEGMIPTFQLIQLTQQFPCQFRSRISKAILKSNSHPTSGRPELEFQHSPGEGVIPIYQTDSMDSSVCMPVSFAKFKINC